MCCNNVNCAYFKSLSSIDRNSYDIWAFWNSKEKSFVLWLNKLKAFNYYWNDLCIMTFCLSNFCCNIKWKHLYVWKYCYWSEGSLKFFFRTRNDGLTCQKRKIKHKTMLSRTYTWNWRGMLLSLKWLFNLNHIYKTEHYKFCLLGWEVRTTLWDHMVISRRTLLVHKDQWYWLQR